MTSARMSTLAHLRGRIERIEASADAQRRAGSRLAMPSADAMLKGGLAKAAVHEVFCEGHRVHPPPASSRASPGGSPHAGRWSGCRRIFPNSNPVRCR